MLRCHPTRILAIAISICAAASLPTAWLSEWRPLLLAIDLAIIGVAVADAVFGLLVLRHLEAGIAMAGVWSRGRDERVTASVRNRGRRRVSLVLAIDLPEHFSSQPRETTIRLDARRSAEVDFAVRGEHRGAFPVHGVHLGLRSPLGLWRFHVRRGASATVRIYPDLRQVDDYGLLARTNRLGLIGIRSDPRPGGNLEFERLRPFIPGDPLSRIDWKATARRDSPAVREFRSERNQNLILLLDCGRMLSGSAGDRELLDHAIESTLLLAHIALAQGDRVGLLAYAEEPLRLVPTGGGRGQFAHLIHAVHDLTAAPVESRHDLAFLQLARRFRQRSLVCVVTAFLDETNAGMLARHLGGMVGRHLPLGVFLRQEELFAPLRQAPANHQELLRAGVAANIATWRRDVLNRLDAQGVRTIDCHPEELNGRLVSAYLRIKASRLL